AQLVAEIGSPAVRSMLDCSAAGRTEKEPLPALIDRWLPQGVIAHVQVNDRNRQGPGQGEQRFAGVFAALRRHRYAGDVAVEPFDYLRLSLALARDAYLAGGANTAFGHFGDHYAPLIEAGATRRLNSLTACYGPALIDRALLDALCRALGISFYRAIKANAAG